MALEERIETLGHLDIHPVLFACRLVNGALDLIIGAAKFLAAVHADQERVGAPQEVERLRDPVPLARLSGAEVLADQSGDAIRRRLQFALALAVGQPLLEPAHVVNVGDRIEKAAKLVHRQFRVVLAVHRVDQPRVDIQLALAAFLDHAIHERLQAFRPCDLALATDAEVVVLKNGVDLFNIAAVQLFPDRLFGVGAHLLAALLDVFRHLAGFVVDEAVEDLLFLGLQRLGKRLFRRAGAARHRGECILCRPRRLAFRGKEPLRPDHVAHHHPADHLARPASVYLRRHPGRVAPEPPRHVARFGNRQVRLLLAVNGGKRLFLDRAVIERIAVTLDHPPFDFRGNGIALAWRILQGPHHLGRRGEAEELRHFFRCSAVVTVDRPPAAEPLARHFRQNAVAELFHQCLAVDLHVGDFGTIHRAMPDLVGEQIDKPVFAPPFHIRRDFRQHRLLLGPIPRLALAPHLCHHPRHQRLFGLIHRPPRHALICGEVGLRHAGRGIGEERTHRLFLARRLYLGIRRQHPVHDLADFRRDVDLEAARRSVDAREPRLEPRECIGQRQRRRLAFHDVSLEPARPFLVLFRGERFAILHAEEVADRCQIVAHGLRGFRRGRKRAERLKEEMPGFVDQR